MVLSRTFLKGLYVPPPPLPFICAFPVCVWNVNGTILDCEVEVTW